VQSEQAHELRYRARVTGKATSSPRCPRLRSRSARFRGSSRGKNKRGGSARQRKRRRACYQGFPRFARPGPRPLVLGRTTRIILCGTGAADGPANGPNRRDLLRMGPSSEVPENPRVGGSIPPLRTSAKAGAFAMGASSVAGVLRRASVHPRAIPRVGGSSAPVGGWVDPFGGGDHAAVS
jgi:hypothetical protein